MTSKRKHPAPKTTKPAPKKAAATKKDAATTPSTPKTPRAPKPPQDRDPRLPAPGTTTTRVFNGKTLTLKYLDDGVFEFEGERFSSVSGAAKKASGLKSVDGFGWWGLNPDAARKPRERDPRLPKAGTTLKVEHGKKTHEIEVGDHDFKWKGETFTSISALAKKASGAASINGFLWAGLVNRPEPAAKATAKTAKAKASAMVDGIDLATPQGQRAALAAAGIGKRKGRPISKPRGQQPETKKAE